MNLTRELFKECLNAYTKDSERTREFENLINKYSATISLVMEESESQKMLLKTLKELTNDKEDLIECYLFEKNRGETFELNTPYGEYVINDYDDLYDACILFNEERYDEAYYIAEKLILSGMDIPKKDLMETYMYICNNTDLVINKIENSTNYKEKNIAIELKYLKEKMEQEKVRR